jgi:hypothetical protein
VKLGDVDFTHRQHRLADALVGRGRVVARELLELAGDDLPRDAERFLAPAAGTGLAAVGGEDFPVVVDLVLPLDAEIEGERLVEVNSGPAFSPITSCPATVNSTTSATGFPGSVLAVNTLPTAEFGTCSG